MKFINKNWKRKVWNCFGARKLPKIFSIVLPKIIIRPKINGWTLKEIEKGKIKIKNFEVDGGHPRDLPNNQFMNNRSVSRMAVQDKAMFVDDNIDIGLVPLYACQNKEEIKN